MNNKLSVTRLAGSLGAEIQGLSLCNLKMRRSKRSKLCCINIAYSFSHGSFLTLKHTLESYFEGMTWNVLPVGLQRECLLFAEAE